MALFPEGASATGPMETSNFAHVIFQNVGKSFLPHAALECHYTLTPFIKPHQKDWVGIFKVGWSTARDYYTFLWSPYPENYVEGSTVHRTVVFQGYYVPKDDGEFYQFCYVTHKGDIRGASTPFQFRADTPTEDDLLTVEDESNSDILVVTTKVGLLEQKVEEAQKEREELLTAMALLQKEKEQLREERERLQRESEDERQACVHLRSKNQELLQSSQILQEEKEEVRKKHEEVTGRIRQLEEDLIGVTQRGIQKETELDGLKDRLRKLTSEKDTLESQLKNERDERELYKIHLKNTELENTKLTAELQMLKSVDMNKEITVAQLQEEVGRLKACVAQKESLHKELLASSASPEAMSALKEQLRQKEEQLQATRQQAAMLSSELRDAAAARDRTMSELYHARLGAEALRASLTDAQAECRCMQGQLEKLRAAGCQEARGEEEPGVGVAMEREAELQREVEDLKLRLQMAAEHYKEMCRECQKLRKQVAKLSGQQGDSNKGSACSSPAPESPTRSESPESPTAGSLSGVDVLLDTLTQERSKGAGREASDRYRKCKQMLSEERERSCMFADELAKMEEKWKEQCRINESLRQQLAEEEERRKSQVAEKDREVRALKERIVMEKADEELQKNSAGNSATPGAESARALPIFLQYPLPYPQEPPSVSLVPQRPAELQFGNPYAAPNAPDGADGELSPEHASRPSPTGPPSWDNNVVCIQPSRNLSPPDGLEDPEDRGNLGGATEQTATHDPQRSLLGGSQNRFCFDSSLDIHKRCPLCEVIFPPHYEQSKFEEHVESHWKVCPMCSEQFPLDCDQQLFENHVLTHFDGNVLNFD
ncbi:tax1-binding protein 1 homolog B-like isoform X4 [Brienomyrus brachyistius]|uniref:tax1-binding protein 1 homolog B-like isoform X4 n=1 Tax=Brienomyrus brachyistius TaxID=42636 RepID=UPI0020B1CF0A|nr:tax1-binding protein 1 homolog B-like isoform X4 [Brienomyrus brachyistius]